MKIQLVYTTTNAWVLAVYSSGIPLSEASINLISCKYRVIHIWEVILTAVFRTATKSNELEDCLAKKSIAFKYRNWGIQHLCSPPVSHLLGMTPHPSAVISSVFEEGSVTKPLSCFCGSCSVFQFFVLCLLDYISLLFACKLSFIIKDDKIVS